MTFDLLFGESYVWRKRVRALLNI